MKRIFVSIILSVAAVVAFISCARSESDDFNTVEQEAFDKWISKNAPDAKPLGESGMYYEVLESAAQTKAGVDVKGKWVELNYVMRDLSGNIAYSRDEGTARQLGTYNAYTHYVPDRLYIATSKENSNIPSGIYTAITSITPGEMWKVYIPSRLGFASSGFTITTGYGGQKGVEANVPMILDSLRILDIIDNPEKIAQESIDKLASSPKPEGWGMMRNDTVKKGIYLDIMRRLSERDTIMMNQSADIYYKVRFLDGKLITSNVDSVLYNNFGVVRTNDKTSVIRVTRMSASPANENHVPAKVFYAIIAELRYGDIGRVVVPSEYTYNRNYLHPDKSETAWGFTAGFQYDGYKYEDFDSTDTDYYFGTNTFYYPSNGTSAVPTAEIKPYTPLVYEFIVKTSTD